MPNYKKRLLLLRQILDAQNIDAYWITTPDDLFYLTGFHLSRGEMLITPTRSTLWVDARYYQACTEAPCALQPWTESSVMRYGAKFSKVYASSADCTHAQWCLRAKKWKLTPSVNYVALLRSEKSNEEYRKIGQALHAGQRVFEQSLHYLEEGISEKEFATILNMTCYEFGGAPSFAPIVAFAEHTAIPHHTPTSRLLKRGDLVLIDWGIRYDGYCSDLTRTFFFQKRGNAQQVHLWKTVYAAFEQLDQQLQSATSFHALHRSYCDLFAAEGGMVHAIGHGIGLAVHEEPHIQQTTPWRDGTVLALEPALYTPHGGVRLEGMWALHRGIWSRLDTLAMPMLIH